LHHDEGAQDLGFRIGTLPIEQRTVVLQGGKVTKTTYCTVLTGLNKVHSSLIGATDEPLPTSSTFTDKTVPAEKQQTDNLNMHTAPTNALKSDIGIHIKL
jgi:hypothetical protein